ncbi:AAA family ATPase [Chloroflexota bacterium]
MSHIISFQIDGLAGREETYAKKLNRDVNIFFGLNGSGKTSLLRILHSAMFNDTKVLHSVPFKRAEVDIYTVAYQKAITRTIDKGTKVSMDTKKHRTDPLHAKVHSINEIDQVVGSPKKELKWITKGAPAEGKIGRWRHIYLPTWRLYTVSEAFPTFGLEARPISVEREYEWDEFFGKQLEGIWSKYNNEMLSSISKIQAEGLAGILRTVLTAKSSTKRDRRITDIDLSKIYKRVSAFLERQGTPGVLGSIKGFSQRYNEDVRVQKAVAAITSTEEKIEKAMAPRRELEKQIERMFTGNKKLVFKDTGITVESEEGDEIPLGSLSSGEKHLMWILIQTLLAADNTLMIDEPEISMHIDWQGDVISAMRHLNPKAQIIMATHSPSIMAMVPDDKIFRL